MPLLPTIHGRGATGSKPAASAANEGYLYYDTTLSRLERSNGTTWDVIEGAGGLADQGTATYLDFTTAAAPANPAAGKIRVYSKTGDTLAQRTSGGTETVFGAGGGSSPDGAGTITNTKTYAAVANGGSVALGFTPTNGRIILGYISTNTTTGTSLVQTNVTWTLVCRGQLNAGNEQVVEVWLGVVAASPGTSVTVNFVGNNAQGAAFEEFSGLATVDGAEGWLIRSNAASEQNQYKMLAWPGPGGRAICVVGNSTGNAIAVPTGWTRNIAAGSYGGSASLSILTRDESATGNTAAAIYVAPVASDVHVAAFVHLIP